MPDDKRGRLRRPGCDVYARYLERAATEGYEDFNGVMWRAAEQVRRGKRPGSAPAGGNEAT